MQIGINSPISPQCRKKMDTLIETYRLNEHLAESGYVFDSINKSLSRAKTIASSLKAFARTPLKEEIKQENLLELIRMAIDLIPNKYRSDADILINIDPAHMLFANRIEIAQLFLNLIQNALESTESKGKIIVTAKSLPEGSEVQIADQGNGIPREIETEIFKPFFTTKDDGKHIGLGLTIALEIVEKYAGHIRIKSTKGKGTIQTVHIKSVYKDRQDR